MVLTAFQSLIQDPLPAAFLGFAALVPVLVAFLLSSRSKPSDLTGKAPRVLPSTLPVLGNLLEMSKNLPTLHTWLTSLCQQYGADPFSLSLPGEHKNVFICSPPLIEEVMKTHFDDMPKGDKECGTLQDLLGHGIFATDGAKWLHQRKTASNLFTARAMRDTMTESMRRYTVVLERILTKARNSGDPIDVFQLMNKLTIEAFAKMGFGIDMNCLDSEVEHPFQSAFDSCQRMLAFRFFRPSWLWEMQRVFNFGAERTLKEDIAVIDKIVLDIVAQSLQRRQQLNGKKSDSADIVSLFLDRFDDSTGEQFDPTYLRDIVVNFLIAGRDTTAQAMSWCFYNLSQRPDVVAKIRAEIAQHLPDFASGARTEPPTMEEVQQLTYLEATLREKLRLYPSVPGVGKSVGKDVILSDGTLLRAGWGITIPIYAMGRMEFIWGSDAKQFKPER